MRLDEGTANTPGDFMCLVEGCGRTWTSVTRRAVFAHVKGHHPEYRPLFIDQKGIPLAQVGARKSLEVRVSRGWKG